MSAVLLGLAAIAAALTTTLVYVILAEYGPTTGSRVDGAKAGIGFGAIGFVVVGSLALAGLVVGRRWLAGRIAAVAVVALALLGVVASGAQAAVVKYDGLPRVPDCTADGSMGPAGTTLQNAFAGIPHPQPFGAGWSSESGCGANLLNATRDQAASHYRRTLPAEGWTISRDDAIELRASRGPLVFTLSERCGELTVAIEQPSTGNRAIC